MIRVPRLVLVAAVAASVGMLAACSPAIAYSDLERPATADDLLPSELPAYASGDFVDGTVRSVGEHDGIRFFLARTDLPGVCVVVYRSENSWVTGCSESGAVLGTTGAGVHVVIAPDHLIGAQRGTPVGANLVVVD
jgi:hypothetical protein